MIGVPRPPSSQPAPSRGDLILVYVVAGLALLAVLAVIFAYAGII